MIDDGVFIEKRSLEPLKRVELYEYIRQARAGALEAREKVIKHNIKLVLNQVFKKFFNTAYDKKELVSVGMIGLIKAVDNFDVSKNFDFSTYAVRCIDNEILMFLRKNKKYLTDESLTKVINVDNDGNEIFLEDMISDKDNDFVTNVLEQEILCEVLHQVEKLEERDQEIIKLYFGFYNNRQYSQKEIGVILRLSQSFISRRISTIVNMIGENMKELELLEKSEKRRRIPIKCTTYDETLTSKLKLIYDYFDRYIQEYLKEIMSDNSIDDVLSKGECIKILLLINTSIYAELLEDLSPKEALVIACKLGIVEGTDFSIKSLAYFLKISEKDVLKIIKRGLILYKEQLQEKLKNNQDGLKVCSKNLLLRCTTTKK